MAKTVQINNAGWIIVEPDRRQYELLQQEPLQFVADAPVSRIEKKELVFLDQYGGDFANVYRVGYSRLYKCIIASPITDPVLAQRARGILIQSWEESDIEQCKEDTE